MTQGSVTELSPLYDMSYRALTEKNGYVALKEHDLLYLRHGVYFFSPDEHSDSLVGRTQTRLNFSRYRRDTEGENRYKQKKVVRSRLIVFIGIICGAIVIFSMVYQNSSLGQTFGIVFGLAVITHILKFVFSKLSMSRNCSYCKSAMTRYDAEEIDSFWFVCHSCKTKQFASNQRISNDDDTDIENFRHDENLEKTIYYRWRIRQNYPIVGCFVSLILIFLAVFAGFNQRYAMIAMGGTIVATIFAYSMVATKRPICPHCQRSMRQYNPMRADRWRPLGYWYACKFCSYKVWIETPGD